jgi:phosphopentomutase
MFVGLGETDEYAHRGDYRSYLAALHRADAIVGRLATQVALLTAAGHPSTLLITTDHGRASGFSTHGGDSPESSRVWLVATGAGILARGTTSSNAPRHLSDVSQTLRSVLGLPRVNAAHAGHVLTELFAAPDPALAAR